MTEREGFNEGITFSVSKGVGVWVEVNSLPDFLLGLFVHFYISFYKKIMMDWYLIVLESLIVLLS